MPKISDSQNPVVHNGTAFYYMDENTPYWKLSDKGMTDTNHAVYNTLQQIYNSKVSTDVTVNCLLNVFVLFVSLYIYS